MRKRLLINRQVTKLADSKTAELVANVLAQLINPPSREKTIRWPLDKASQTREYDQQELAWHCTCIYCRTQMLYAYARIRAHQANKACRNDRVGNRLYDIINSTSNLKTQLESLEMCCTLEEHIVACKKVTGRWSAENLISTSLKGLQGERDLVGKVNQFIGEQKYVVAKRGRKQSVLLQFPTP